MKSFWCRRGQINAKSPRSQGAKSNSVKVDQTNAVGQVGGQIVCKYLKMNDLQNNQAPGPPAGAEAARVGLSRQSRLGDGGSNPAKDQTIVHCFLIVVAATFG
jgi:hypothetical protein